MPIKRPDHSSNGYPTMRRLSVLRCCKSTPAATRTRHGRSRSHGHTAPQPRARTGLATVPRDRAAPCAGTTRPQPTTPGSANGRARWRLPGTPPPEFQTPAWTPLPRAPSPLFKIAARPATVPSHHLPPLPPPSSFHFEKQGTATRTSRCPWFVGGGRGEGEGGGDGAAEGCVGRGAGGGGRVRGAAGDDDGEQDQSQLVAQHQLLRLGEGARALLQGRLARYVRARLFTLYAFELELEPSRRHQIWSTERGRGRKCEAFLCPP